MFTLRELAKAMWNITEVDFIAYDNYKFQHEFIFGPHVYETSHMWQRRRDGNLTIIDRKINAHGDSGRRGPELGWGLKEKEIPKELLDAPINHINIMPAPSFENHISISIELPALQAEILKEDLKAAARSSCDGEPETGREEG